MGRRVYLVVDAEGKPVAAYSDKRDALAVVSPESLVTLPLLTTSRPPKAPPAEVPLTAKPPKGPRIPWFRTALRLFGGKR